VQSDEVEQTSLLMRQRFGCDRQRTKRRGAARGLSERAIRRAHGISAGPVGSVPTA
jgi:hypothetical protein